MARPSKKAPNVGVLEFDGKIRKAAAIWVESQSEFFLRLYDHGRPVDRLTIATGRTIKHLKREVPSFKLTQTHYTGNSN